MTTPAPPSSDRRTRASSTTSALLDAHRHQQQNQSLPRRKLRVLCLHGHRTNGKVMVNQTKGLRVAMGEDDAEFIFLDAPFPALGPTDPVIERIHAKDAPFYEWWYAKAVEDVAEGETQWLYSLDTFDETIAFMDQKILELGPIDVVVAFSQGSVLLTVLTALYVQTRDHVPWKLCVCVGGAELGGVQFRDLFETPDGRPIRVPVPSIHVVGRADPLYEEGLNLANAYDSHTTIYPASPLKKMVVYHDGGHRFPVPRLYRDLYDELAQRIYEHCGACDGQDTCRGNNAFARL